MPDDNYTIKVGFAVTGADAIDAAISRLQKNQNTKINLAFNISGMGDLEKFEQQLNGIHEIIQRKFGKDLFSGMSQGITEAQQKLTALSREVENANLAVEASQKRQSTLLLELRSLKKQLREADQEGLNAEHSRVLYLQQQQAELKSRLAAERQITGELAKQQEIAKSTHDFYQRANTYGNAGNPPLPPGNNPYNVGPGPEQPINTSAALKDKSARDRYREQIQRQTDKDKRETAELQRAFQQRFAIRAQAIEELNLIGSGVENRVFQDTAYFKNTIQPIQQFNQKLQAHDADKEIADRSRLLDYGPIYAAQQEEAERRVRALRDSEFIRQHYEQQISAKEGNEFINFAANPGRKLYLQIQQEDARRQDANLFEFKTKEFLNERNQGLGSFNDPRFLLLKKDIEHERLAARELIDKQFSESADQKRFGDLLNTSGIRSIDDLVKRIGDIQAEKAEIERKLAQGLSITEEEYAQFRQKAIDVDSSLRNANQRLSDLRSSGAKGDERKQEPEAVRFAKAQRALLFASPEEREDLEGFKSTLGQRFNLHPNQGPYSVNNLRKGGFFEPSRLLNPETAVQLGFATAFGGLPSVLGGVIGGATPLGPSGALLGSTLAQGVGELIFKKPVEAIESFTSQVKESGLAFERSVLGIAAIRQANLTVSGLGGRLLSPAESIDAEQARAKSLQLEARSKLLPLGIGGETEATFVQGVVSALSQRGLNATSGQTARISELVGGAITAQRPSLLENTQQLLKDLQDILGGGATARRTVLGQILRPVLPELQKATNADEIVKALQPLQAFVETAKTASNPIVVQNRLQGAIENLRTQAGEKFLERITPGLEKLAETLSKPEVVEAAIKLADTIGLLTDQFLKLQSKVVDLAPVMANTLLPAVQHLPEVLASSALAVGALSLAIAGLDKNSTSAALSQFGSGFVQGFHGIKGAPSTAVESVVAKEAQSLVPSAAIETAEVAAASTAPSWVASLQKVEAERADKLGLTDKILDAVKRGRPSIEFAREISQTHGIPEDEARSLYRSVRSHHGFFSPELAEDAAATFSPVAVVQKTESAAIKAAEKQAIEKAEKTFAQRMITLAERDLAANIAPGLFAGVGQAVGAGLKNLLAIVFSAPVVIGAAIGGAIFALSKAYEAHVNEADEKINSEISKTSAIAKKAREAISPKALVNSRLREAGLLDEADKFSTTAEESPAVQIEELNEASKLIQKTLYPKSASKTSQLANSPENEELLQRDVFIRAALNQRREQFENAQIQSEFNTSTVGGAAQASFEEQTKFLDRAARRRDTLQAAKNYAKFLANAGEGGVASISQEALQKRRDELKKQIEAVDATLKNETDDAERTRLGNEKLDLVTQRHSIDEQINGLTSPKGREQVFSKAVAGANALVGNLTRQNNLASFTEQNKESGLFGQFVGEAKGINDVIKAQEHLDSVSVNLSKTFAELDNAVKDSTTALNDFRENARLRELGALGQRVAAAEKLIKAGGSEAEIPADVLEYINNPRAKAELELNTAKAQAADVFRKTDSFRRRDEDREQEQKLEFAKSGAERQRDILGPQEARDQQLSAASGVIEQYAKYRNDPALKGLADLLRPQAEKAFDLLKNNIASGDNGAFSTTDFFKSQAKTLDELLSGDKAAAVAASGAEVDENGNPIVPETPQSRKLQKATDALHAQAAATKGTFALRERKALKGEGAISGTDYTNRPISGTGSYDPFKANDDYYSGFTLEMDHTFTDLDPEYGLDLKDEQRPGASYFPERPIFQKRQQARLDAAIAQGKAKAGDTGEELIPTDGDQTVDADLGFEAGKVKRRSFLETAAAKGDAAITYPAQRGLGKLLKGAEGLLHGGAEDRTGKNEGEKTIEEKKKDKEATKPDSEKHLEKIAKNTDADVLAKKIGEQFNTILNSMFT